jgi:quinol monooxygenase YgiN
MIAIAGTADYPTRERRDEALLSSVPYQAASRADEPGCLAYYFAPDPVVGTRMVVWELWADEAALAAHFTHSNYLELRAHLRQFGILSADFRKYRIDRSEAVYDDTRTARADFFTLADDAPTRLGASVARQDELADGVAGLEPDERGSRVGEVVHRVDRGPQPGVDEQ